ncbi:hypothetical protein GM60_11715 [Listeria monocytogenes]|uniref:Uncharacterized protein n=1 Tax=Listeria monocytogenes TaxID=1639 RepID=A0A6W4RPA9_LISMN|nr:hypothetical protein [Listeria monocytogenes]EHC5234915.1 hypothetical protein [Listeria monocytogenes serotype 1/2a]MBC2041903.1 hypothetical protein [Listeria welshimeri]HCJ1285163.1 hypothetical protein [Listeria innocua]EAD2109263.1 hypothetical protein [Listeria monocytogenes]EAD5334788.1 hypothetical protein [Listeria monocytogenes]
MHRVNNSISPKKSVLNSTDIFKENKVRIDFHTNANQWLKSVRVGDYTNFLNSEKQFSKMFYKCINKIIPSIQVNWKNILSGVIPHCHAIENANKEIAIKVMKQLYPKYEEEMEIWEFGVGGGPRIIASVTREDDYSIVRPLFIDYHHLIYPSEVGSNNTTDTSKKVCKWCPDKKYNA